MSKHTPGPWASEGNAVLAISGTKGVAVLEPDAPADFWGDDAVPVTDSEEMQANARLIANAPDLLAICEELAALPDRHLLGLPPIDAVIVLDLVSRARETIANAKGE